MVNNPVQKVSCAPLEKIIGGRLGIFARQPLPGLVKTRLSPPLSPEECAEFYRLALQATVSRMMPLAPVLFYSGAADYFQQAFPGVTLVAQGEGPLDARLVRAFDYLMNSGDSTAVVIGSDSPDLPLSLVTAAWQALEQQDCAAIPAVDGGYALIGLRQCRPQIFAGIAWSTPQVMDQTRAACRACGLTLAEVGCWEDVDDLAALLRLLERAPELAASRYAAACLQRHGVLDSARVSPVSRRRCGRQSASKE